MSKANKEDFKKQMKDDFKLMCEVEGVDFNKVDYKLFEKDNLERFKKHLEEFGEISEFEYVKDSLTADKV